MIRIDGTIHRIQTNTLKKGMNNLILPALG